MYLTRMSYYIWISITCINYTYYTIFENENSVPQNVNIIDFSPKWNLRILLTISIVPQFSWELIALSFRYYDVKYRLVRSSKRYMSSVLLLNITYQ